MQRLSQFVIVYNTSAAGGMMGSSSVDVAVSEIFLLVLFPLPLFVFTNTGRLKPSLMLSELRSLDTFPSSWPELASFSCPWKSRHTPPIWTKIHGFVVNQHLWTGFLYLTVFLHFPLLLFIMLFDCLDEFLRLFSDKEMFAMNERRQMTQNKISSKLV